MAVINLFDGTKDPKYGNVLRAALAELAKIQSVRVSPSPGGIDVASFNLVKRVEQAALNTRRDQVDLRRLIETLHVQERAKDSVAEKVVIVERDLYSQGLNWCFGGYTPWDTRKYLVVSVNRIRHPTHLFDIFAHELGHMYGAAADPNRSNTEYNLGLHCTNDLCVMQQKTTVQDSVRYSQRRRQTNAAVYCGQCTEDLKDPSAPPRRKLTRRKGFRRRRN